MLLLIVIAFSVFALRDSWADVRTSIRRLSIADVTLAGAALLAASYAMFTSWRCLLEATHSAPVPRKELRAMYFCSQVGKYVPGSVWPAVIQAQIGTRNHIPRVRVVTAYLYSMVAGLAVGGVATIGALAIPASGWVRLMVAGAVAGGLVLSVAFCHPSGSQRLWRWVITRRASGAEVPHLAPATTVRVLAWCLLGWVLIGVQAWCIARPLGASVGDMVPVASSFVLAVVVGVVALPLPAGAGIREAVVVLTLGTLLGDASAVSVALIARGISVVMDIALAVAAGLPTAIRQARRKESPRAVTP